MHVVPVNGMESERVFVLSTVSPCSSCSRNSLTISCATRNCETVSTATYSVLDFPSKRPAMDSAHCQSPSHQKGMKILYVDVSTMLSCEMR